MSEQLLYVVYLDSTPIAVHKYPWAALNEAKERYVPGKSASVVTYKHAYPLGVWGEVQLPGVPIDEFSAEAPTDPDCVPCSHAFEGGCDDEWKKG